MKIGEDMQSVPFKEQMEVWYKPVTHKEELANWFAEQFDKHIFDALTKGDIDGGT